MYGIDLGTVRTFRSTAIACLLQMSSGIVAGYTSPALPSIFVERNGLNFSPEEESWVGSMSTVGAMIGCLLAGEAVERWGRKLCMMVNIVPFVLGWLLIIGASDIILLLVGRFVTGMCTSFTCVIVPGYITEVTSARQRDFVGAQFTIMHNIGQLVMYAGGAFLSWRYLGMVSIVVLTITMLLIPFIPESPRWLLTNGHCEIAKENLQWLRGTEEVDQEFQEMLDNMNKCSAQFSLIELRSKAIWKPTVISLTLIIFQNLTGIDYIIFYGQSIFQAAGVNLDHHLQTSIVAVGGILGCIASAYLLRKFARRQVLIVSGIPMAASMFASAIFFTAKIENSSILCKYVFWLPVTSIVVFQFAFTMAWGPVPYIIINELLPTRARAKCSSIVQFFMWLSIFFATKFSITIQESVFHLYGLFFLFTIFVILGIGFVFLFVPETKGKTLEAIENEEIS